MMYKHRLKSRISHSLRGMIVESLYTAFLMLLTLFIAFFFRLILS